MHNQKKKKWNTPLKIKETPKQWLSNYALFPNTEIDVPWTNLFVNLTWIMALLTKLQLQNVVFDSHTW